MSTNGPLPKGWTLARIDQAAVLNPRKEGLNLKGDDAVHFVPMAAVGEEFAGVDVAASRPLHEVIKGYTPFQSDDVLFAKITPCMENGKIAVVPPLERGWGFGSTEFHVLRPNGIALATWLAYFLYQQEVRRDAQRSMTGSAGQLRVPAGWLAEQQIPLAPLREQRRIVAKIEELFSKLDAGVAALARVRANLKRYRAAVLKAAVEGKLTADWRAKHKDVEPAAKLLDRILAERRRKWEEAQLAKYKAAGKPPPKGWKDKYKEPAGPETSGLPDVPEGWCWATLRQLAELVGGITKGQKHRRNDRVREVPYLRVANVQRGFLDLACVKQIPATEAEIREFRLLPGDVLFTEGGDRDKLGRGWIWDGQIADCIHQNHIFRGRVYSGDVQPRFLSHYGNSAAQGYFVGSGVQTTNLASINLGKLGSLPVPVPPAREQEEIVAEVDRRLSIVDELEAEVATDLKRAARLRQSILKRAFAGRLVPQDPADEPAAKLLERINAEREKAAGNGEPTGKRRAQPTRRTRTMPSTRSKDRAE
jgi:type I restriction enzyme S subunit